MNKVEHLLACLAEECSEVAKECSKAQRFGLDDIYDGQKPSDKIVHELIDILAIVEMLEKEGALPSLSGAGIIEEDDHMEKLSAKIKRVEHYMEYVLKRGTLTK